MCNSGTKLGEQKYANIRVLSLELESESKKLYRSWMEVASTTTAEIDRDTIGHEEHDITK